MGKIRITRTQVFEYDPFVSDSKNTPHDDYCERVLECVTIEAIMAHDKEDLEDDMYTLTDLVREDDATSTVLKWEVIDG